MLLLTAMMENLRIEDCIAEQIPTSRQTERETVLEQDLTKMTPETGESLHYPAVCVYKKIHICVYLRGTLWIKKLVQWICYTV